MCVCKCSNCSYLQEGHWLLRFEFSVITTYRRRGALKHYSSWPRVTNINSKPLSHFMDGGHAHFDWAVQCILCLCADMLLCMHFLQSQFKQGRRGCCYVWNSMPSSQSQHSAFLVTSQVVIPGKECHLPFGSQLTILLKSNPHHKTWIMVVS